MYYLYNVIFDMLYYFFRCVKYVILCWYIYLMREICCIYLIYFIMYVILCDIYLMFFYMYVILCWYYFFIWLILVKFYLFVVILVKFFLFVVILWYYFFYWCDVVILWFFYLGNGKERAAVKMSYHNITYQGKWVNFGENGQIESEPQ